MDKALQLYNEKPDALNLVNIKNTNTTFRDLVSEAVAIEAVSHDCMVNVKDGIDFVNACFFNGVEDRRILRIMQDYVPHGFSKWGFQQFCSTLGVPSPFMEKYLIQGTKESIDAAIEIMRYWKNQHSGEVLMRYTDDILRGVLSSRYNTYDDSEFLRHINDSVMSKMDLHPVNKIVSPDITKVRVISNDDVTIGGEKLHFGFDISNSRVGRSSVKIQFLLYRAICSNGMIFGGGRSSIFTKSHRSKIDENEIVAVINDVPKLINYVTKWVENGQNNKLNQQSLDRLTAQFKAQFNSEATANNIINIMDEKYDRTLWGYTNAITEVAQNYNVFIREQMEGFAGGILRKAA